MADIATLGLQVHSGPVRTATRDLLGLQRASSLTERAVSGLSRAAAAVGAALSAAAIANYADAWTTAGNKVRAAAGALEQSADTLDQLYRIALRSRTGLDAVTLGYSRLAMAASEMNVNQGQVLQMTETVSKALQVGGATASEATAAVTQLTQALGSGVLQGDELRSLRENSLVLAQAIATEFGTTVGGLKALGEEGALSSDRVAKAILTATDSVEASFARLNPTIGSTITNLSTQFTRLVGLWNEAVGGSTALIGFLDNVGRGMERLAGWAGPVAEATAGVGDRLNVIMSGLNAYLPTLEAAAARVGESIAWWGEKTAGTGDAMAGLIPIATGVVNSVIGLFVGAVESVTLAWESLPGAFANIGARAANALVDALEAGANKAIELVNNVIRGANVVSGTFGGPLMDELTPTKLGRVEVATQTFAALGKEIEGVMNKRASQDYVGAAIDGWTAKVDNFNQRVEQGKSARDALTEFRSGKAPVDRIAPAPRGTRPESEADKKARKAAESARKKAEREAERLAEETAEAEHERRLEALAAAQERVTQRIDAARDAAQGFAQTFVQGIMAGEGALASLGNALDQLASKLADLALNSAFDALFGKKGEGGIGGLLSGLFGAGAQMFNAGGISASAGITPFAGSVGSAIGSGRAGLFHAGGIVGRDGVSVPVDPRDFDNAPRFHRGTLKPDERRAILQTGERVLSRSETGILERLAGLFNAKGIAGARGESGAAGKDGMAAAASIVGRDGRDGRDGRNGRDGRSFVADWHDAPRLHSGGKLKRDERRAILQTEERVLSREQNKDFERFLSHEQNTNNSERVLSREQNIKNYEGRAQPAPKIETIYNDFAGVRVSEQVTTDKQGNVRREVAIRAIASGIAADRQAMESLGHRSPSRSRSAG